MDLQVVHQFIIFLHPVHHFKHLLLQQFVLFLQLSNVDAVQVHSVQQLPPQGMLIQILAHW